jgi:hypothetical protein
MKKPKLLCQQLIGNWMATTIRIDWERETTNEKYWNEVCARCIEMFGLPGGRYFTHAYVDYMEFIFNSEKDAIMFGIEHNGRIIHDNELAIEAVGKFM